MHHCNDAAIRLQTNRYGNHMDAAYLDTTSHRRKLGKVEIGNLQKWCEIFEPNSQDSKEISNSSLQIQMKTSSNAAMYSLLANCSTNT